MIHKLAHTEAVHLGLQAADLPYNLLDVRREPRHILITRQALQHLLDGGLVPSWQGSGRPELLKHPHKTSKASIVRRRLEAYRSGTCI